MLLALGIDEALRTSNSQEPRIRPGNVDDVLKWGMDCPDAAYSGASIRGDASYRVTGTRGTVRYLGFQVMGGMATLGNVVADTLDINGDGTFELVLSAKEHPGNWLPLAEKASTLIVRQFFYDWAAEEPARLHIERLDTPSQPVEPPEVSPTAIARQVVALGDFVESSLAFWADIESMGRAEGLNSFRTPHNRTDIGGAEENVTVWGSYELGPDDALIISVTPPEALYWSIAIGDPWWASADYANHQASLNGHQAVIDPDGVVRAVLSRRDPGVANWLDPCGAAHGPMIVRWLSAAAHPVPDCRLVPIDELDNALPPETTRVTPAQRAATLAARRAGVRRRFAR
jgi:hypothetical protein